MTAWMVLREMTGMEGVKKGSCGTIVCPAGMNVIGEISREVLTGSGTGITIDTMTDIMRRESTHGNIAVETEVGQESVGTRVDEGVARVIECRITNGRDRMINGIDIEIKRIRRRDTVIVGITEEVRSMVLVRKVVVTHIHP